MADDNENTTQDEDKMFDSQSEFLLLDNFKFEADEYEYKNKTLEKEKIDIENKLENDNKLEEQKNKDHIPLSLKIFFSLPAFSKIVHALIFYENKGSSLLLISFFTALARCVEIILKPLIAHWSDNSSFSLGRRKPFMLFGCGFYALFLVLIFTPPGEKLSPVEASIWFGSFYVFFFIADTICNIPYQAIGPELSRDTKEREKLYLVFYFFQYIGVLFVSAAPVIIQNFLRACDCSSCEDILILNKDQCRSDCQSMCLVKSNADSLFYMCLFVGIFFIISIILLCCVMKEKKEFSKKEKSYLVPTLYRLINNKPFIKMLIPWIIDATIVQIFATMLPFFITFIINPQKYCLKNNIDLSSGVCNTTNWIGANIFMFFIFCIAFTFGWHWLVQYSGKKRAWQSYSLISIVTYSLFLICGEGMMVTMVVLSAINSLPAGGGYLTDVFVSDVIDYDEFVTGKRNEGIYIVFSTFTPKIVGIFAQSIPLTVLSLIGFVPSLNGRNFEQPPIVNEFIRFYLIAVPVLLALIGFFLKHKYPIDSESKMLRLKNAIQLQNSKVNELNDNIDYYKIQDPVYNKTHIQILCKNESQRKSKIVADHFYDLEYLYLILKQDFQSIRKKLIFIIISYLITLVIFVIIIIFTFRYLEEKSLSLIPIFSLFVITVCLLILMINIIRFNLIKKVINKEYVIDSKYITLYIYQMKNRKEIYEDDNELADECIKLSHDCNKCS